MDSWFEQWFNTPYYHLLYSHRDAEEAEQFLARLIEELDLEKESFIVDLACGAGRHSIFLNREGFNVLGLDISENSIAQAREYENETLHFEVRDVREPLGVNQVDAILNLFTSFGYFDSIEEHNSVLENASKALRKKGLFVLDFFNADHVIKGLVPEMTIHKNDIDFHIKKYIHEGRIIKEIKVNDRGNESVFHEKVWLFSFVQLREMLEENDFTLLNTFGNYNLDHFDSTSERLILIAQKNA